MTGFFNLIFPISFLLSTPAIPLFFLGPNPVVLNMFGAWFIIFPVLGPQARLGSFGHSIPRRYGHQCSLAQHPLPLQSQEKFDATTYLTGLFDIFLVVPVPRLRDPYSQFRATISSNLVQELRTMVDCEAAVGQVPL